MLQPFLLSLPPNLPLLPFSLHCLQVTPFPPSPCRLIVSPHPSPPAAGGKGNSLSFGTAVRHVCGSVLASGTGSVCNLWMQLALQAYLLKTPRTFIHVTPDSTVTSVDDVTALTAIFYIQSVAAGGSRTFITFIISESKTTDQNN